MQYTHKHDWWLVNDQRQVCNAYSVLEQVQQYIKGVFRNEDNRGTGKKSMTRYRYDIY